jgi:Fe2+ transport system protein B
MTSPGQHTITGNWVQQQQNEYSKPHKDDILSEPDTIDREVAAATAHLSLSSPRQSPYTPRKSITTNEASSKKSSSSSTNNSSHHKKRSDRALEKLQTEVMALTEQVDRLRTSIQEKGKRPSRSWQLVKILFKHLMANSAILCIVFYILYKQKSPIAYSIIDYIRPIIQAMMRKLIQNIVFWKVTV